MYLRISIAAAEYLIKENIPHPIILAIKVVQMVYLVEPQ
jgi:hypothetical protein